jgi:LuxR family transcriptional regulator, maltose regulon positive regulatory protein
MSEILLATKTHIPPLHSNLVNRPHLIRRLNDGIAQNHRLTLVSAPAGYGKSTLLSEWVSQIDLPVAWLSLEKGENNPVRFWNYFITALSTIPHLRQANLGGPIPQSLHAGRPPPIEILLASLVNDFSNLEERAILVLDDLHVITESQIHQGLVFLVDHLPQSACGLHLVIASRMDPPWPLARWRVRDELTEVRSKDLRFSPEEASTFLNTVMGLKLAIRDIALLDQRTEGWIAGIQMAALSMQGRGNVDGFLGGFTGSHRFVLDYLLEEVLSQQKPEILNFLLCTSLLEHLTAPLCDAITDGKDGQAILDQLERSNMFLVPMDDERRWYRYHHLFSDMLQVRLKLTYPEIIPLLHGKACTWYMENGYLSNALKHAISANDLNRLISLVEKYAFTIFDFHQASTFLSWLNTLPGHVIGSNPWLNIARAWLLVYLGQMENIEPSILEAEEHADQTDRRLLGYIAAMRTLMGEVYFLQIDAISQASRAFELLPPQEYRPRAFVSYHLSNVLAWQGDILLALKALEDAFTWSLAAGDPEMAMAAQFEKANILHGLGRLTESLHTFEKTFQMVDSDYPDKKNRSLPVGYAYIQLSTLYLEWNNTSEALLYANEGIQVCRLWGYSDYLYNGLLKLADVLFAVGDLDGALIAVQEAKQVMKNLPISSRSNAQEAVINLARGDIESASAWVRQSGLHPSDTLEYSHRTVYMHYASILQAQGKLHEAYDVLEGLKRILEKAGTVTLVLEVLTRQIIILHALEDREQALSMLQRALELAKPERYIRIFINKGAPMAYLLRVAFSRGIETQYISELLSSFDFSVSAEALRADRLNETRSKIYSARLTEPLSERELQVLRLLDSALTNEEIGRELYVSVNTIRTHIRNIYAKLGVNRRGDAVWRAKELKLI